MRTETSTPGESRQAPLRICRTATFNHVHMHETRMNLFEELDTLEQRSGGTGSVKSDFAAQELQVMDRLFDMYDKDGNGLPDGDEYDRVISELALHVHREAEARGSKYGKKTFVPPFSIIENWVKEVDFRFTGTLNFPIGNYDQLNAFASRSGMACQNQCFASRRFRGKARNPVKFKMDVSNVTVVAGLATLRVDDHQSYRQACGRAHLCQRAHERNDLPRGGSTDKV